jgi:hypothetical protein
MGMVTAITLFWSNKPNPAIPAVAFGRKQKSQKFGGRMQPQFCHSALQAQSGVWVQRQ